MRDQMFLELRGVYRSSGPTAAGAGSRDHDQAAGLAVQVAGEASGGLENEQRDQAGELLSGAAGKQTAPDDPGSACPAAMAGAAGKQRRPIGLGSTEVSAGRRARKGSGLRAAIAAHLQELGAAGATDEELERRFLSVPASSLRGRRSELVRAGLVEASGQTRPSRTGSPATVWRWRE